MLYPGGYNKGNHVSSENIAWDAGYSAYYDGVYFEDNPFDDAEPEHWAWDNGWEQAELNQALAGMKTLQDYMGVENYGE